jgi:hypothetical protein
LCKQKARESGLFVCTNPVLSSGTATAEDFPWQAVDNVKTQFEPD